MGKLRVPEDCPHASVIRRAADVGVPLDGLYCLDCGALVRRVSGDRDTWQAIGPVMGPDALMELRARLHWEKDPPANIRLAPDAPGYAVKDNPKD